MGQVLGHSAGKYVTGRMLQTSADRRWSNLLVERWTHDKWSGKSAGSGVTSVTKMATIRSFFVVRVWFKCP